VQLNRENEKGGVKVTMLAFLIKACVATLKKFPDFNASLDATTGDAIIRKNYWHIGFAADTPNGLLVPVIRDADQKGLFDLVAETAALAAKARDASLAPADMQGGTFSISSLGGIGGPHLRRSSTRRRWRSSRLSLGDEGVWMACNSCRGLILRCPLSWDHRVVDGAGAARFNVIWRSCGGFPQGGALRLASARLFARLLELPVKLNVSISSCALFGSSVR